MDNMIETRYYSNLIGFVFLIISFLTTIFIEEKLIRQEKDNNIGSDIDIEKKHKIID